MPFIESWDVTISPINELPKLKYDPANDCSHLKYFTKDERVVEPKGSINFNGTIYVLIDEVNYSAADSFSSFCKSTDFATLVGEETSGGGMGFAPIIVKLPNSGLIVRFPIDMALNPDGSTNVIEHTKPDIQSQKPLEKVVDIINE
jgi:C-terminal processing protease CtpA/Prc